MKKYIGFFIAIFYCVAVFASYIIPDSGVTPPKLAASTSSVDFTMNCSIAASVSSNALTIALKDKAGSNPSASSPCAIAFRNSTLTTGTYDIVKVTSSLSVVVSSGSTLGCVNSVACHLIVYAINSGSGVVLGVSNAKSIDESRVYTTTAEGGSGGADSKSVIYTTSSQTSKPLKIIGRIIDTESTAGTWATGPTVVANGAYWSVPQTFGCRVNTVSCVISNSENCGWVTSTSDGGTGICTINYNVFNSTPTCQASVIDNYPTSGGHMAQITSVSSTAMTAAIHRDSVGAVETADFSFTCTGY